MSDWPDQLDPDERASWDAFVEHVRTETLVKMDESLFVMSLVPRGEVDVKFAVELGLSIMLDKPIVAVVQPGQPIPERLRMVCDEVVEADIDVEEGRRQVAEAIARMAK